MERQCGHESDLRALNIIYDEDEKRGLIWLNVVSLFFTICAIARVGVAISLVVVLPLLWRHRHHLTIRLSAICAGR